MERNHQISGHVFLKQQDSDLDRDGGRKPAVTEKIEL